MLSSPSIVPDQDDHDTYLVLDDFGGRLGRAWRETDEGRTDREIVITDLMTGQYSDPVRVVAFNTAQGWSRDVTNDIADDLAKWFSERDREIPPSLEDFIQRRHVGAAAVAAPEHGLMPMEFYQGRPAGAIGARGPN